MNSAIAVVVVNSTATVYGHLYWSYEEVKAIFLGAIWRYFGHHLDLYQKLLQTAIALDFIHDTLYMYRFCIIMSSKFTREWGNIIEIVWEAFLMLNSIYLWSRSDASCELVRPSILSFLCIWQLGDYSRRRALHLVENPIGLEDRRQQITLVLRPPTIIAGSAP